MHHIDAAELLLVALAATAATVNQPCLEQGTLLLKRSCAAGGISKVFVTSLALATQLEALPQELA